MRIETPLQVTGDGRYELTSSFNAFTASLTSSIQGMGDGRYILTASINQQMLSSSLFISGNLIVSGSNVSSSIILGDPNGNGILIENASNGGSLLFRSPASNNLTNVYANSFVTLGGNLSPINRPSFNSGLYLDPANVVAWDDRTNAGVTENDTSLSRVSNGIVGISGSSGSNGITAKTGDLILSSSVTSNVFVSSSLHVMGTNKAANYNDKIFIVGSGSSTGTDFLSVTGDGRIFLGTDNGTNSVVNVNNFGSQDKGLFSFKDYATNPNPLGVIIGISDPSYNVGIAYGVNGSNVYLGNTAVYTAMLVVSGSTGDVALNYQNSILYHFKSNLVLSSSAGSIVAVSSSLDFPNKDKSYHVRAVNSDLIFSSSTSKVTISGNLQTPVGQVILSGSNGNAAANLALTFTDTPTLGISNAFGRFTVNVGGATRFEVTANDIRCNDVSNTYTQNVIVNPTSLIEWGGTSIQNQGGALQLAVDGRLNLTSSAGTSILCFGAITGSLGDSIIYSALGKLILSSSVGSVVVLSSSMDFTNTDKSYHIRSVNSDLILSASTGNNVVISGTLSVKNATGTNFNTIQVQSDRVQFLQQNSSKAHISVQGIDGIESSNGYQLGYYTAGLGLAKLSQWLFYNNGLNSGVDIVATRDDNKIGLVDLSGSSGSTGFGSISGEMILSSSTVITSGTIRTVVSGNNVSTPSLNLRSLQAGTGSNGQDWSIWIGTPGNDDQYLKIGRTTNGENSFDLAITNGGSPLVGSGKTLQLQGSAGVTATENPATGFYTNSGNFMKILGLQRITLGVTSNQTEIASVSSSGMFVTGAFGVTGSIYNWSGALILSSSVGSIVQISGGLLLAGPYTSASLPSAPPTGTFAYVSDLGFAAIYTGATSKWMRIVSSSF